MTQQTPQAQVALRQRNHARHSGRMTAEMRAMALPPGPRVLRIGVVQGGRVVEERVVARRTDVTVGTSERCTFTLPDEGLPSSFRLFELVGDGFRLNWLDTMSGRIAVDKTITELAALRGTARAVTLAGVRAHQIALGEATRGKVVIGATTFLFQLVAPAPAQARPQLPTNVLSGSSVDWPTTIIAAFSFLFHFGLVGSIYSDWMDPLLDEQARTAQLVESLRQLPSPPAVEVPEDTPNHASTVPSEKVAEKPTSAGATTQSPSSRAGGPATSDAKAAALSKEMTAMNVEMLAALDATGTSTERVLSTSDVPTGLLDREAAESRGIGANGIAGLDLGRDGSGAVRPGETGRRGLAAIGDTGRGDAPISQGGARTTRGPSGNTTVGPPQPSGGSVANAASVVAQMQAGFRRCYNRELPDNPDMKGSVRITAKIGPNGEVASASASGGGGLSPGLVACVSARVASAQFAPPDGGGATLVIPVSFFPQ